MLADDLRDMAPRASGWVTLDAARVKLFADATEDWQFIHLDAERAAAEVVALPKSLEDKIAFRAEHLRAYQGKRLAKRDDARAISLYRSEGASPQDIRAMIGL